MCIRDRHEHAPEIDVQGPLGGPDQLLLVVEDGDKDAGEELYGQEEDGAQRDTGEEEQLEGPADPVRLACAEVETQDRLGALGEALEGHQGELHEGGEHGHSTHSDVPAGFQQ